MTATSNTFQIVVGCDFSEAARITLDRAIALASADSRNVLHVLTVLDEVKGLGLRAGDKTDFATAEKVRGELAAEMKARLDAMAPPSEIQYFVHVRIGRPSEELLNVATEVGAHLILVGSHGRTGLERLVLGSVSERVVREAKCPVLVVREREYDDVELLKIVDAPADHADHPYIRPHRYSYNNQMMAEDQDPNWPLN